MTPPRNPWCDLPAKLDPLSFQCHTLLYKGLWSYGSLATSPADCPGHTSVTPSWLPATHSFPPNIFKSSSSDLGHLQTLSHFNWNHNSNGKIIIPDGQKTLAFKEIATQDLHQVTWVGNGRVETHIQVFQVPISYCLHYTRLSFIISHRITAKDL